MKRVLLVYYSQSGQLQRIIEQIASSLIAFDNVQVDTEILETNPPYPFPWGDQFFNCFAESVKGIPCELNTFKNNTDNKYDLVIIGVQSWYLSPSVPVTAFLDSDNAKKILKDTPVITVHGSRNMWVSSQEIIKNKLNNIGAKLVANIALADKHPNYISAITIIKWLVYGNKGPYFLLPQAGISDYDIIESANFSPIILESVLANDFTNTHTELLKKGSLYLRYHLMQIEFVARKIFVKFATYVDKKPWGDPSRLKRIKHFKIYLLFVLFVLSPIVSVLYKLIRIIFFPIVNKKMAYYRGISLK